MILTEVTDRAFDGSPAALLIGQLFRIGLRLSVFPFDTAGFQRKPRFELVRITFRMVRQAVEHSSCLIEHRAFDAFRHVCGKLVFVCIGAPVPQRLEESPIA